MGRKKNTKLGTLDVQPTSLAGPGDVNKMDPPSILCNLTVAGQRKKKICPSWRLESMRTGWGEMGEKKRYL
jgi:hypothetical protein